MNDFIEDSVIFIVIDLLSPNLRFMEYSDVSLVLLSEKGS